MATFEELSKERTKYTKTEKALINTMSKRESQIENEMLRFFAEAQELIDAGQYVPDKLVNTHQANVNRIARLGQKEADEWGSEDLKEYFDSNVALADKDLQQARYELKKTLISGSNRYLQRGYKHIAFTFEDHFKDLFQFVARDTKDIFRQVQIQSANAGFMKTDDIKKVVKEMKKRLQARGVTGFYSQATTKNGVAYTQRWSLERYVDMAARTVTMNARVRAKEMEYLAHGADLVRVSEHAFSCPKCAPWQGRIISLSGETPGYPTMYEAREAGLFHPCCRHTITVYDPLNEVDETADLL